MSSKKTLVIGATNDPSRYAYMAISSLLHRGHEVVPLGVEEGTVHGLKIETEPKPFEDIDTVTLYINPRKQKSYLDYIVHEIHPKRIIFNPGTENPELVKLAKDNNIEVIHGCTLVMLSAKMY